MKTLFPILLLSIGIAGSAQAQVPSPAEPPAEGAQLPAPGRNPAISYLMESYGISQADAEERIAVQNELVALTKRLNENSDPTFAGIAVTQSPRFKVQISFADKSDRKAFLESLSPKLRKYVQLRVVKASKKTRRTELAALSRQLAALGIVAAPGYNPETDNYYVDVNSSDDAAKVRAALPALVEAGLEVRVSPIPKSQAGPSGAQAGDSAQAGYAIYDTTAGAGTCTWGFAVTYGTANTSGIITAAHCGRPKVQKFGTHWLTFSTPATSQNSGAYDYQIFETTGVRSDYYLNYTNKNGIPEFSGNWFTVNDYIIGWNQFNGQVMCKSGAITGITCGSIIDEGYAWRPGYWFIKVSHTKQYDISAPGDSGGPWFMYPGTSTDVTAAGIHVAGDGTGPSSIAVYMPIDRAFDHLPNVKVKFQVGTM
jgi:hypothetical protein